MVEIVSQKGRHVVITGANTGIGRAAALELAAAGASLVLAGRSAQRTQPVVDEIVSAGGTARFVALDLGSFASIRAAADELVSAGEEIHTLINNAGLGGHQGITKEGFEIQFGVNHVGPFHFTRLLLPLLRGNEDARVVNVASRAHTRVKNFNWENIEGHTVSRTGFPEYCNSKLANVLFSAELARREEPNGIRSYALHPGVVATDIWRKLPGSIERMVKSFMISAEQGAETTLHCAASTQAGKETGLYYDKCRPRTPSKAARDSDLAARLWEQTEEWTRTR